MRQPPAWLWVTCPPVATTMAVTAALTPSSREPSALLVSEDVQEQIAVDLEAMR